jgi:hypothetical protein
MKSRVQVQNLDEVKGSSTKKLDEIKGSSTKKWMNPLGS